MLDDALIHSEGIDIILAIDISSSMEAEDYTIGNLRASRIEAVKNVAKDFILARKKDRIGIVVFGSEPYTVCPPTLDHDWLLENLARTKVGIVEDGTAIGVGLSAAVNRLKKSGAKSRVVILLTDGDNNAGIEPHLAAEAARILGIRVYTIGAGGEGAAPVRVLNRYGYMEYAHINYEVDEETLRSVAELADGKFFRAEDTRKLREVYREIDKMERTESSDESFRKYQELYWVFLLIAIVLLCLELVLGSTVLLKLP